MAGKSEAQMRYNKKTYVRFPLDLRPEVLEAFKRRCTDEGTTPTAEIKKFIAKYTCFGPSEKEG